MMNKIVTKKRVLLVVSFTLFALANLFVGLNNEKQKALLLTDNVEAKTNPMWYYLILEGLTNNDPGTFYKYRERNNLSCSPIRVYRGVIAKGTEAARMLDVALNIDASSQTGTGNVSQRTDVKYNSRKKSLDNIFYEYTVDIYLTGEDWVIKTCEPCSKDDDGCVGHNCTVYNECAQAIKSSTTSYLNALGIN